MKRIKRLAVAAACTGALAVLAGPVTATATAVTAETSRCAQVHICVID